MKHPNYVNLVYSYYKTEYNEMKQIWYNVLHIEAMLEIEGLLVY